MFRPQLLRQAVSRARLYATRRAAQDALRDKSLHAILPIIPTCPTPTCACSDMPPDLDIDRSIDMNGTMAPYSEHLIVPTGQSDWKSRIEDERTTAPWGELIANVKGSLSQKGQFHDPYHNVVVSTVSFDAAPERSEPGRVQAFLFPSFRVVDDIETEEAAIPDFVRTFLLPEKLHPAYQQLAEDEQQGKRRNLTSLTSDRWAGKTHPISSPTILICSHQSRDSRCGILGPLLHAEFTQYINKRQTLRNDPTDDVAADGHDHTSVRTFASHPEFHPDVVDAEDMSKQPINVGMISHIGGHKFAGNVIIYIPPDYHCRPIERETGGAKPQDRMEPATREKTSREDDALSSHTNGLSPLAGKGIWYGRVEPKHVEGIVEQTIGHGNIIRELFRGGINHDGSTLRLPLY